MSTTLSTRPKCLEFHTSNIQRAQTERFAKFIVRSGNPIWRSPARAFLNRQCNENTYNGTTCFSARQRYFASSASFLHTFFWQDRNGTKQQTSAAFAVWRGRAAKWARPAACGGARDMELASTKSRINGWRRNRRFSCSQQPAVRTVSRGCAGAAIGACLIIRAITYAKQH